jgi:hypothetical protein
MWTLEFKCACLHTYMWKYVYICVCVYTFVYLWLCLFECVYTYVGMYVYIWNVLHTYMWRYVNLCVYIRVLDPVIYVHIHVVVRKLVWTPLCTNMIVCKNMHTNMHLFEWACVYLYTYEIISIHMCLHGCQYIFGQKGFNWPVPGCLHSGLSQFPSRSPSGHWLWCSHCLKKVI